MTRWQITATLAALLAGASAFVAGCSQGPSGPTPRSARYTYSCCRDADINRTYHPGDVVTLHWITAALTFPATRSAASVTLTATLNGPFQDVSSAKADPGSATSRRAAPVQITDETGGTPTSTITIPRTALAGTYNLHTAVSVSGFTSSGDSIIQVSIH